MEETSFLGVDAVSLANGKGDELVLLAGVGPRIISLRPEGGDNLFYVRGTDFREEPGGADWRIYGGTRLWTSPENRLSYTPDNDPCRVTVEGEAVTCASSSSSTGLARSITVQPREHSFLVTYRLKSSSPYLLTAGIWALTCLDPVEGAEIFLPWGDRSAWDVRDMRYWRRWLGSETDVTSGQWQPTNQFFMVRPSGETGKIGFANRYGFMLFRAGSRWFVKRAGYVRSALYPDGGCSAEVYTSSSFYELETLSPLYELQPEMELAHTEEWWAGAGELDVESIAAAEESVDRLMV